MAENDDPEVIDYEVDGYPEDPGGGGFNAGGSIQIEVTPFDVNAALAGRVMYAKATENNATKYYIATQFDTKSNDQRFPYRAKVNGRMYNFDINGVTNTGLYSLYMAKSSISGTGAEQGDNIDPNAGSHGSDPQWDIYNMTSLNYRETVAAGVLNALIGHMQDPLSYDSTKISLLVKKSFDFAVEFMNQAYPLRLTNATEDDQGNVVVNPAELSPADAAIFAISSALYTTVEEGGQQVQKSVFKVMKDEIVNEIHDSLSMEITEGSNVSTKSITEVLHDSLNTEITENNTTVKKSAAELINEQNQALADVQKALYDDSGTNPVSVLTELTGIKESLDPTRQYTIASEVADMGNTLGNIKLDLDAIKTANQGIETALAGSGGSGGVMSALSSMDTNIGTITSDIHSTGAIKEDIEAIRVNTSSGGSLYTVVNQTGGYVNDINNAINNSGGIKDDIDAIRVNTGNIHTDLYDNGTAITQLRNLSSITTTTNNIDGHVDNVENQLNQIWDKTNQIYNKLP